MAPVVTCVVLVVIILHVSLIVAADLLDTDVVLGLDVGFGGGVGPSQGHHAGDVLKVLLVFDFNLWERNHSLVSSKLKSMPSKLLVAALKKHPTGISHLYTGGIMKGP